MCVCVCVCWGQTLVRGCGSLMQLNLTHITKEQMNESEIWEAEREGGWLSNTNCM